MNRLFPIWLAVVMAVLFAATAVPAAAQETDAETDMQIRAIVEADEATGIDPEKYAEIVKFFVKKYTKPDHDVIAEYHRMRELFVPEDHDMNIHDVAWLWRMASEEFAHDPYYHPRGTDVYQYFNLRGVEVDEEKVSLPEAVTRLKRVEWFNDARFGCFLCWSVGAMKELGDDGWNIIWGRVSWEEYEALVPEFNPVEFDAEKIAGQINDLGARYVVFTTKHHAGFSMWDSKVTDFDMMSTKWGKDPLEPLAEAVRNEGIKMGLYFSGWDWHREEFHGASRHEKMTKTGVSDVSKNPLWPKFIDFYHAQINELTRNYGRIDVFWFDAGIGTGDGAEYKMIRANQPDIVINDRCGGGRTWGDYTCCENFTAARDCGKPWESCYRANSGWFYTKSAYWPANEVITLLIQGVSRNGNLLYAWPLDAEGKFDEAATTRMKEVGQWMQRNGESIYGCGKSPLRGMPWGNTTYDKDKGRLYLQLYQADMNPALPVRVEGLLSKVKSANILDTRQEVDYRREGDDVVITLPEGFELNPFPTVIDLEVEKPVEMAEPTFVTEWIVTEPLPARDGKTLKEDLSNEAMAGIEPGQPLTLDGKEYKWLKAQAEENGYLDLQKQLGPEQGSVILAAVTIEAPRDMQVQLLGGSGGDYTVFMNGKTTPRKTTGPCEDIIRPDVDRVSFKLKKGKNTLILRTTPGQLGTGFYIWVSSPLPVEFRAE